MKFEIIKNDKFLIGDVLLVKTDFWYINSFCKYFNADYPHPIVYIGHNKFIDIRRTIGVKVRTVKESIEPEYLHIRPIVDWMLPLSHNQIVYLKRKKYSITALSNNTISMLIDTPIRCRYDTCTTFAAKVLWNLTGDHFIGGYSMDCVTPLSFYRAII